ncbi:MAG: hypothetical protein P8Y84_05770, partial [Desulfuromonadales bacterium]
DMRLMLILLGASLFAYFVTGIGRRFTTTARLYFAIGTFLGVYLVTMTLVSTGMISRNIF